MQIIIDDKYALAADRYCWMIREKRTRKTEDGGREDYYKSVMWFDTIKGAIKGLTELALRTSNVSTLSEALNYNKHVLASIVTALSPDVEVVVKDTDLTKNISKR